MRLTLYMGNTALHTLVEITAGLDSNKGNVFCLRILNYAFCYRFSRNLLQDQLPKRSRLGHMPHHLEAWLQASAHLRIQTWSWSTVNILSEAAPCHDLKVILMNIMYTLHGVITPMLNNFKSVSCKRNFWKKTAFKKKKKLTSSKTRGRPSWWGPHCLCETQPSAHSKKKEQA